LRRKLSCHLCFLTLSNFIVINFLFILFQLYKELSTKFFSIIIFFPFTAIVLSFCIVGICSVSFLHLVCTVSSVFSYSSTFHSYNCFFLLLLFYILHSSPSDKANKPFFHFSFFLPTSTYLRLAIIFSQILITSVFYDLHHSFFLHNLLCYFSHSRPHLFFISFYSFFTFFSSLQIFLQYFLK
jgi:hypothetical protein